jgi:hypothetical protein
MILFFASSLLLNCPFSYCHITFIPSKFSEQLRENSCFITTPGIHFFIAPRKDGDNYFVPKPNKDPFNAAVRIDYVEPKLNNLSPSRLQIQQQ